MGFELWIYRGGIVILLTIIGYLARRTLVKQDQIYDMVQSLTGKEIGQDKEIEHIHDDIRVVNQRLEKHDNAIEKIQKRLNSCDFCPDEH